MNNQLSDITLKNFFRNCERGASAEDIQAVINVYPQIVHCRDNRDWTALHMAATAVPLHSAVVDVLVKAGSEVNAISNWSMTPLMHLMTVSGVIEAERTKSIQALLDGGADASIVSGTTVPSAFPPYKSKTVVEMARIAGFDDLAQMIETDPIRRAKEAMLHVEKIEGEVAEIHGGIKGDLRVSKMSPLQKRSPQS